MTWISVNDELPINPGYISKPVFVCACESGRRPRLAVARCWFSIREGAEPIWYLDGEFYGLDGPYQIAEPVTHWARLPDIPIVMSVEKINLSQSQIDGLTTDLSRIPGREEQKP